jgi:hypothetical protein
MLNSLFEIGSASSLYKKAMNKGMQKGSNTVYTFSWALGV